MFGIGTLWRKWFPPRQEILPSAAEPSVEEEEPPFLLPQSETVYAGMQASLRVDVAEGRGTARELLGEENLRRVRDRIRQNELHYLLHDSRVVHSTFVKKGADLWQEVSEPVPWRELERLERRIVAWGDDVFVLLMVRWIATVRNVEGEATSKVARFEKEVVSATDAYEAELEGDETLAIIECALNVTLNVASSEAG